MIRTSVAILLLALSVTGEAVADDEARTVLVGGSGHVSVPPDMARVSMSVVDRDTSLQAAQKTVADVTARILQLTDGLDIDRNQVSSTGASVQPNYRWNRQTEDQELIGYIAQRQIDVVVRDLEKLGELVEGAVKAGANQVSPPKLDSTRRRDAYRDALANAATDARKNAETLAETLGVKLGPVREITTGRMPAPPRPMLEDIRVTARSMEASAPAETYSAGEIRFDASVTVVFALVD